MYKHEDIMRFLNKKVGPSPKSKVIVKKIEKEKASASINLVKPMPPSEIAPGNPSVKIVTAQPSSSQAKLKPSWAKTLNSLSK